MIIKNNALHHSTFYSSDSNVKLHSTYHYEGKKKKLFQDASHMGEGLPFHCYVHQGLLSTNCTMNILKAQCSARDGVLGKPQSRSEHGGKKRESVPLPGFKLQSSSPQPSHYIASTIPHTL
jgi:hypothetical protein